MFILPSLPVMHSDKCLLNVSRSKGFRVFVIKSYKMIISGVTYQISERTSRENLITDKTELDRTEYITSKFQSVKKHLGQKIYPKIYNKNLKIKGNIYFIQFRILPKKSYHLVICMVSSECLHGSSVSI